MNLGQLSSLLELKFEYSDGLAMHCDIPNFLTMKKCITPLRSMAAVFALPLPAVEAGQLLTVSFLGQSCFWIHIRRPLFLFLDSVDS